MKIHCSSRFKREHVFKLPYKHPVAHLANRIPWYVVGIKPYSSIPYSSQQVLDTDSFLRTLLNSDCPADSYLDATSSPCVACPDGRFSSAGATSAAQCYCAPGSYLDATSSLCVACPDGRFSSAGATSAAQCYCVPGSYLDAASSMCLACPAGLTSFQANASSGCYCAAGVFTNCALNALLVERAPHSVYVGEAWNGSGTLYDLSGNGRDAERTVAPPPRRHRQG